jgi:hypothetical protein
MGYGSYSFDTHARLAAARDGHSREEVFKQRRCHPLMDPKGVRVRESRDSEQHPKSLGVIFALDVTGSMGHIPDLLARKELPTFMKLLMDWGIASPQVLFMAVGDATCDKAPLQVGQFESEAELMDQWLTWSYLEGGGGGSFQESYELAMYFAARHTSMDCWEKRERRGYFFMTGDEHPYPLVSKASVHSLIGDELVDDMAVGEVIAELATTFEPFFLIPDEGRGQRCGERWRDLLGDHAIVLARPEDTCLVAAALVALAEGALAGIDELTEHLAASGLTRKEIGGVLGAVEGYADSLRERGASPAEFPPVAGVSGYLR